MSGSRPPSVRQRLQQAWLSRGLVAWLLWPELFDGRPCRVDVEREGSLRGRTTIDWNNRMKRAPNALVIGSLDAAAMFDRMIDALETLP